MSFIHHQYLITDNELYKDYLNTMPKRGSYNEKNRELYYRKCRADK